MSNFWLALSGGLGALTVALGAFGAHLLRLWLPLQKVTIYETAVRYQMFHVLALLGVAVLMEVYPAQARGLRVVAALYVAGMLLFCGGLYGTALSDYSAPALLAPVGGLVWIVAWGLLGVIFWRARRAAP